MSSIHSAAIHLLRRVRVVDEEMDITPARASALSVLVFGGSQTLTELAQAEQVTTATMSRLVAAMEAEGMLERGRARREQELERLFEQLSAAERATVDRAAAIIERCLAASSVS